MHGNDTKSHPKQLLDNWGQSKDLILLFQMFLFIFVMPMLPAYKNFLLYFSLYVDFVPVSNLLSINFCLRLVMQVFFNVFVHDWHQTKIWLERPLIYQNITCFCESKSLWQKLSCHGFHQSSAGVVYFSIWFVYFSRKI